MASDYYVICDADGVLIADRISLEERRNLQGLERVECLDGTAEFHQVRTPLIRMRSKRRPHIWLALVGADVIRAFLRRKLSMDFFTAANATVVREHYSNAVGSGRLYAHNHRTCEAYGIPAADLAALDGATLGSALAALEAA